MGIAFGAGLVGLSGLRPAVATGAIGPPPATAWRVDDLPLLGPMRDTIVSTLDFNRIEYSGASGYVETFWAGDAYHGVFARDMATIGPLARYFYSPNHLRTGVEEFLAFQTMSGADIGALPGVVFPGGRDDKATATSDEDVSVVHLAYLYFRHEGTGAWLVKPVRGRSVLSRLNAGMDFLFRTRFDSRTGLVKRGHTTDWGDVKSEGGDNPTDMSPGDSWTASIYDQACVFRALLEMANMNDAVGQTAIASSYRGRAAALRDQANSLLWQSPRGFYRLHVHLSPMQHAFDEDALLGAGNIEAVRFGLADAEQARLIFRNFEKARLAAQSPRVGLVTWPPYPIDVFPGMMPGEYQNGGLWDWWAGRQILAEFEAGQSALAYRHLAALADDWATRPGEVWEWQELWSGKVRGSPRYSGAASTVGSAIVEGLFGIEMTRDSFAVSPRLAGRSGAIVAQQPSTSRLVQLELGGASDGTIAARYSTSYLSAGRFRYLLPPDSAIQAVIMDGMPIQHASETVGDDEYVAFIAPGGSHSVLLLLQPAV